MSGRFLLLAVVLAGCVQPSAGPLSWPEPPLAAVAGGCGQPPLADPELEGAHPVEFYIEAALRRNPEIQALQRQAAALAERVQQVTALPDPMLSDLFWPIPMNSPQSASGRMPNSLMLAQEFPWFGKLRLRGAIADRDTQIALTELAEAELKVVEAVRAAYYEIYFHQVALAITQDNDKLLSEYIQIAEARYKVGQTSQQDVLRAQLERSKVQDMLWQLRRELRQAQADLARLLSTAPDADLEAADAALDLTVPRQIERLYEAALANRPELQGKLHAVLRDQAQIELARKDYFPDVKLGVGWDVMTTADALAPFADGKDNLGFSISLNIPIWYHKLRAGVREAELRTAASARQYDAARDEALRMIRRAVVQATVLEQQLKLYREQIVPRAEQTLQVSTADYRVGRVDMTTLIDNWTQLLQYRIQLRRLEASLGQALAALERAVGAQVAGPAERLAPPRMVE